jgi:hypothetical protein
MSESKAEAVERAIKNLDERIERKRAAREPTFTRTSQQFCLDDLGGLARVNDPDYLGDCVRAVLERHLKQVLEGVAERLRMKIFPRRFSIDVRLEQDGIHYKWVAVLKSNEEDTG